MKECAWYAVAVVVVLGLNAVVIVCCVMLAKWAWNYW